MPVSGAHLKTCRVTATRAAYSCGLGAFLVLLGSQVLQNAVAEGDTRTISLHHIHTNEDITITYKRDGRYDEGALEKLNWFLRDWRREQETRMDPHLIDLVWEVQRETGSQQPIWVVCGYRSPETNAMLRRRSGGVARFSQHMLGHAMDFYIPGVPLEELRVIGLRLQRGGVGFYPTSGSPFVHMDIGDVRHWPRMTREQLVRVFPDGRTVHVPTDGRPLSGYALALADIRKRGSNPSIMSLEAAHSAGIKVADASIEHHHFNPFARLLGIAGSDEEDEASPPAPAETAAAAPQPAAAPVPLRTPAKATMIAAIDRAENKLAAEKAKLIKVASKAHFVARAEAAPLAALTPNQIILARGYWQGLSDAAAAAPAASGAVNRFAADQMPLRTVLAGSAADVTGSAGSFATTSESSPGELALAYAEQSERDPAVRPAAADTTGKEASRPALLRIITAQTGDDETTVAVKRVSGQAESAILTVANKKLVTPFIDATRLNDPWLRALLLSPNVKRFLSITALGGRDFRSLAALIVKPTASVMMTFAAEPNAGLTDEHFTGSAVVFVSTVTYPTRTAALQ